MFQNNEFQRTQEYQEDYQTREAHERIVVVPKIIRSGTITALIKRLVNHQYDRVTLTHRNYTGHMVYDGYSIMMDIYHNEEHIASWDSLPGRLTYFTNDLVKISRLIHAVTKLDYELKEVGIEEGQDYPVFLNWTDFIATPAERYEQ